MVYRLRNTATNKKIRLIQVHRQKIYHLYLHNRKEPKKKVAKYKSSSDLET